MRVLALPGKEMGAFGGKGMSRESVDETSIIGSMRVFLKEAPTGESRPSPLLKMATDPHLRKVEITRIPG